MSDEEFVKSIYPRTFCHKYIRYGSLTEYVILTNTPFVLVSTWQYSEKKAWFSARKRIEEMVFYKMSA
jgi:hypothetical protein